MAEVLGMERQVVLARELTKRYEEFIRGSLAEAIEWTDTNQVRGEFVILVAGNDQPIEQSQEQPQGTPIEQVDQEVANGLSTNAAIKLVAKRLGIRRQELYKQYHQF
ncbi:uroporphyrin-III C tetrapyrrole methyltransferase [Limosilactobacillus coleohominis DSM 14060]|nr:uroporphyrin-III C tetrapyrrole methyltransferase [Limosilactobacillus coleohominis DSM 14060]